MRDSGFLRVLRAASVLILLAGTAARAEDLTAEKVADIRRFFELSGQLAAADAIVEPMTQQLMALVKAGDSKVTSRQAEVLGEQMAIAIREELNSEQGLLAQMIDLYHRSFTHEEVRAMNAFYESSVGRKLSSATPGLTQEGFRLGAEWGRKVGPRVQQRAREQLAKEKQSGG